MLCSRLIVLAVAASLTLLAQKKPVTLEALKAASGRPPGGGGGGASVVWAPDGKSFLYRQGPELMLYTIASKSAQAVAAAKGLKPVKPEAPAPGEATPFDWENRGVREQAIQWSPDSKNILYVNGGDLFWIPVSSEGAAIQLTATPTPEHDPKLSPDATKVSFRREHDLYVLDIATKKETRLTRDGSDTLLNGELDWVYPEELSLSTAHWWSPDSKSIAYLQFDVSRLPLYPQAELIKPKAYAEPERYPQAGDPNSDVRLGVIPAAGGNTRWADLGDTRDTWLLARVNWAPDSKAVYVHRLNRIQNRLDLLKVNPATGAPAEILRETDPYWVNLSDGFDFLKDGKRFLWMSERDGFRHIYLYGADGRDPVQITKGQWQVDSIAGVDEDAGLIYYVSTDPSPLERHFYSIRFDGTGKIKLSTQEGSNSVSMSPTNDVYLLTHSSTTSPSRTTLHDKSGKELAVFREADRKVANEYEILPTEFTSFKTKDGALIYARIIKPKGFQQGVKYPAIVSVYGGPHAQSVRNGGGPGLSWEQVMAHKGYVIWQCDNRGSANRGHAFEAAVFRKLGQLELEDQREGVAHLVSLGYVDPARVGIQGWSYGGFMTLNAMLNAGDVFKAGISGAPVTNFRNYDTIYTERYMGLPSQNPDGYAGTNLPLKAGNLKGNLLLVHNFEDDNVLFQNMLQATEALQRNNRLFELMVYPQKAHGVSGAYRNHLNELMTNFFDRTLQAPAK
ncbi:MAG: S9 family peptidase [Acidobacteria bacterium]|nr:S9 family peptidase [Acidobacteriota bacterium]